MGTYTALCTKCGKDFQWFSGNFSAVQNCPSCSASALNDALKIGDMSMGTIQVVATDTHVEALKQVISVQEQLIAFLKDEVARLKASQIVNTPINPVPGMPVQQPFCPYQPYIPTTTPNLPLTPPFIVTCGDVSATSESLTNVLVGTPLPNGSIQS